MPLILFKMKEERKFKSRFDFLNLDLGMRQCALSGDHITTITQGGHYEKVYYRKINDRLDGFLFSLSDVAWSI